MNDANKWTIKWNAIELYKIQKELKILRQWSMKVFFSLVFKELTKISLLVSSLFEKESQFGNTAQHTNGWEIQNWEIYSEKLILQMKINRLYNGTFGYR